MKSRLLGLLRSVGMRHGMIMGATMILAGGLDYMVNIVAGRWLEPVEYGIFVSVSAILQVLLLLSIAIRMVVAFYTAELSAQDADRVGAFIQRAWRWAWQWGLVATALIAVVSPTVARLLQMPNSRPLWAASAMVLFLFMRESSYGALQGVQAFGGLGLVQVTQALLRLVFAAAFIFLGWKATGAIVAQPVGCIVALALALWWLRPYFKQESKGKHRPVSWHYSMHTLLGLAVFGLLTNLDAIFVKLVFTPQIAGNYGPVVTLAKISLFLPWAIGIVLFPKVTHRQATGRDPRPILLMSLAAALAPGLAITSFYFLFSGVLVKIIFTGAYANPGVVLAFASMAATLYAGLFIWLNYSLSLERRSFVYALIGVLVFQASGMFAFGRENLMHMTLAMVAAGVLGNLAGFVTTWSFAPMPKAVPVEVVGQS